MKLDIKELYGYIRTTILDTGRFPPPLELSKARRRAMGGQIFVYAHDFVGRVGRGMRAHPHLFAGYPVSGEELLERQARARAWRVVADGFLVLHEWANDWFLKEQSEVIADARAVLQQIEAEERLLHGGDGQAKWRRIALTAAFLVMEKRRQKAQANGRRKKKTA
jgi:hypothetical protein